MDLVKTLSSPSTSMWPCLPRNRISRSSHPITLTDSPGIGSSINSNWHAMMWEQTSLNPISGGNSAACTYGEWHKKKSAGQFTSENLQKKLNLCGILDFSPPSGLLPSQGKDKERKTERWPTSCGLQHEPGQQRWNTPWGTLLLLWGWWVPRRDSAEVWRRRPGGG